MKWPQLHTKLSSSKPWQSHSNCMLKNYPVAVITPGLYEHYKLAQAKTMLSIILTVYLYRQLSFSNKKTQTNHKTSPQKTQTKTKKQTSLGYLINKVSVLKQPKGPCA